MISFLIIGTCINIFAFATLTIICIGLFTSPNIKHQLQIILGEEEMENFYGRFRHLGENFALQFKLVAIVLIPYMFTGLIIIGLLVTRNDN